MPAGQRCNTINEIIDDKENCAMYFVCNVDKIWSRESCSFPLLFSDTEMRCEDFVNVSCGVRFEPRSPLSDSLSFLAPILISACLFLHYFCSMQSVFSLMIISNTTYYQLLQSKYSHAIAFNDKPKMFVLCFKSLAYNIISMYTGGSSDECRYINESSICQCANTMDLNFDMCAGLTDGFYTWPSRKLSKYFIHCLEGRTLPMECEGSVLFNFRERECSLVYDDKVRTVLLTDYVLVNEPPLDADAAGTHFVLDISVPLPQTTPAYVFNSLTLNDRGNSIGKPFLQTIFAASAIGDVTQTNFVPSVSSLFQQPLFVVMTNIKISQPEASSTVLQSCMSVSDQAIKAIMTQVQFIPERYTLLLRRDSTVILKPSVSPVSDVFKSTPEIDPSSVFSYITNYVIASTLEASFPISKTLIPHSFLLRMASTHTNIYVQNSYSSDNGRTAPNKMTKELTSAGNIQISLLSSPLKHYYFVDSSTWIDNSANKGDFSLYQSVSTLLTDQNHSSIFSEFSEMNTVNYETYLSVGRISEPEIMIPSDNARNYIAVKTLFVEHQSTSYPFLDNYGPLKAYFVKLPHETLYLSKHLSDLDRSLNEADSRQVRNLKLSDHIQGDFDKVPSKNIHLSSTSANDPSTANKNSFFSTNQSTEINNNTCIMSRTFLSQLPNSSNENLFCNSTNTSTSITPSRILTSKIELLTRAILEATVLASRYQSSIHSQVSNQESRILQMKATSDENMESKMAQNFLTKHISKGMSSMDQFGFKPLNFLPKLENRKTTFSKMVLVAQFILSISMPITITEYIQPTMTQPAAESPPFSMKHTEESKQNLNTYEATNVSTEPWIFPSKTMSKFRGLMMSELIQSSFIPVTFQTFQALIQGSRTRTMDTYSLLRISETFYSSMRLHDSFSQIVTFEVSEPKGSPGSMPLTYDSCISPSRMVEKESTFHAVSLSSFIVSTSNSLVKVNNLNASRVNTLNDVISSSVKDTSNFQPTESMKSNRTNNSTKLILSSKNEKMKTKNVSNTSFIFVLVGACAGFIVIVILTTVLIICHRRRKEKPRIANCLSVACS
ncbi:hypothetical protein ACJMK2_005290 [Sinanodonta woodiana]|uniref:Chitin-binding type-2 domain-containing protein n=1 Tax=Sinanodonta woodiana TaxID=1069815 RepID=A0ABD3VPL0_SINWO